MQVLPLELLTGRGPLIPLLGLALAGALVYLLASRLARDADTIAEQTGLGGLWIGSMLLAVLSTVADYVWFRGMYEGDKERGIKPFVVDTHPKIWAKQNPLKDKAATPKVELTPEEQAALAAFKVAK